MLSDRSGFSTPGFLGRLGRGLFGDRFLNWLRLALGFRLWFALGFAIFLPIFLAIGLALELGFTIAIVEFRFTGAVFTLVAAGVEVLGLTVTIRGHFNGILFREGVFEPANGFIIGPALIGREARAIARIRGVLGLRILLALLHFAVAATAAATAPAPPTAPAAFLLLVVAILVGKALIGPALGKISHWVAVHRGQVLTTALAVVGSIGALAVVGWVPAALTNIAAVPLIALISLTVVVAATVGDIAISALRAPTAALIRPGAAAVVTRTIGGLTISSWPVITLSIIAWPIVALTIIPGTIIALAVVS